MRAALLGAIVILCICANAHADDAQWSGRLQLSGMLEKGLDAPKLISAMMTALNPYFFGET